MTLAMRSRWIAAVYVSALTALSLWLYGYEVGMHNHAIQLPLVLHRLDPGLYPGDTFVATLDRYTTFAWTWVAMLARHVALGHVLLVGHVAVQLALYALVFGLTAAVAPSSRPAPFLAAWAFLWCGTDVGGEGLHWFYFSHTQVGFALGLAGIWCWLRGRRLVAFGCAGFLFELHAMQALYVLLVLVALELHDAWRGRIGWRALARRALAPVLIFGALAAPAVLWVARIESGAASARLPELLRTFFPRHFFASAFEARDWVPLVWQGLVAALGGAALWRTLGGQRAAVAAATIVAFMAVAGALVELAPHPTLLKLHVFRVSAYFAVLALVLGAGAIARASEKRGGALALLALAVWLVPALSLIPDRPSVRRFGQDWGFVVLGAGLALVVAFAARWPRRILGTACATLALALAPFAWHVAVRRQSNTAAYHARQTPWIDVQKWTREHTPRDARIAVPPYEEGFRAFSERTVTGEWKDCAAVMWAPEYEVEWLAWLESLGVPLGHVAGTTLVARLEARWAALSLHEIKAWARARGATHLVLAKAHHDVGADLGESLRFENAAYFVVELSR
jgi:hypothetical protein